MSLAAKSRIFTLEQGKKNDAVFNRFLLDTAKIPHVRVRVGGGGVVVKVTIAN